MNTAVPRLEFGPPRAGGRGRALVLALLAHLVLLGALTLGVQWRRDAPLTQVQAELWSSVPQAAAPKLVEAPPAPKAQPAAAPAPPKPAPTVAPQTRDADIALEREKQRLEKQRLEQQKLAQLKLEQQKREQQTLEKDKLEKQRLAQLKLEQSEKAKVKAKEKEKLALDKKREQERQLALEEKQQEEQARKHAEEKKRLLAQKAEENAKKARLQAAQAKEEAAKVEAQRTVNLQRMAGLAGATGAPGAKGNAQKASGGSSSYGGRVSAIVRPNIVFTENTQDNPTAVVEVRVAPDGTIVGRKLNKSSGNKAWDDAVLRAIDKTAVLPRDVDGTVPPDLLIEFRPRE